MKREPQTDERIPTTLRLQADLLADLRLAVAERRTARAEPMTQQAIIDEALEQWLKHKGYLGRSRKMAR